MWGPKRQKQSERWRRPPRTALIAAVCLMMASCGTGGADRARAPRPSLPTPEAHAALPPGINASGEALPGTSRSSADVKPKIYPGTGVFLNQNPGEKVSSGKGKYTVNFVDTDIRQVVDRVLGDVLKANYVIEGKISGNVTIQTANPVSREDLVPILESALNSQGASLVDDDGVYRIMATKRAGRTGGMPDPAALGFGIRAVPLKYVSATEMEKILKPIAPEGAIRSVDTTRNMIMLAGTSRELNNMIDTIRLFDVDWLKGMSFAMLPVKSADVTTVVDELKAVFSAKDGGPGKGMVRFVPVKRLNAILAISPQQTYVRRAAAWIDRLDKFGEGTGKQLYVYDVQNRPAADLAELLQEAFSNKPVKHRRPKRDVAPGLEPLTLDQKKGDGGAESSKTKPTPVSAPQPVRPTETEPVVDNDRFRIFADEANNSLVIISTPEDHKMAVKMIKRLDVIPNQVLLEATIAEVTLKNELSYGLQWYFRRGDMNFKFTDLVDDSGSGVVGSVFPGFSYLFSGGNARVALNAISSLTNVNVISSPTLMVLDNRTATLQVGDEVPIVTQQATRVETDAAPIVNAVSYRDTGVILKVTPRVNESGVVLLDIEQEVSDVVATNSSRINSPTIRQRRIKTSVAVNSGESLALGGLIRESDENNQSGVPFLSRIPLLGSLFKSKTKSHNRTELLVLITPRVVRNRAEARAVTNELRDRLRSLTPLKKRIE